MSIYRLRLQPEAGPSHRPPPMDHMDVDSGDKGEPSIRVTYKRKRVEEWGKDEWKGDEDEDNEDNDDYRKPVKRRMMKRVVRGRGEFYTPACDRCTLGGFRCEKQESRLWACVRCQTRKQACHRGQSGSKRQNAATPSALTSPPPVEPQWRQVVFTSSNSEPEDKAD